MFENRMTKQILEVIVYGISLGERILIKVDKSTLNGRACMKNVMQVNRS